MSRSRTTVRRGLLGVLLVSIVAAVCVGCKESKHAVGQIEIAEETLRENPMLGISPAQVNELLVHQLTQAHFELVSPRQRGIGGVPPIALQLEIAFTREAHKEGRDGTYAEVGAALNIRRKENGGSASYEVVGIGESKLRSDDPESRRNAMRAALISAIDQVAAAAHLQLAALEKSDPALVKDLGAKDPRVREFAIRVLSARKNPAVERALVDKLQGSDPDGVRRAIGALVELKNAGAVPYLIDLAKGKDPSFIREIIFALGEIGGEEAEAYLYTVAEGHDQPAVRAAAKKALDELGGRKRSGSAGRADSNADRRQSGGTR
jgi:hypothetical protein